jgi:hypothetical protein
MSLSRAQMLSILNTMDDDHLMQAVSAAGIDVGEGGGMDLGGESPSEGLESWNQLRIDMPQSKTPPLVDHAKITQAQRQTQAARPKPDMDDILGRQMSGMEDLEPQTPGEATGAY